MLWGSRTVVFIPANAFSTRCLSLRATAAVSDTPEEQPQL